MSLPKSPPKERVVVQQPPEKNQMTFAFGKVNIEPEPATEQPTAEHNAAEQPTAEHNAAEQHDAVETDIVDVSPPSSVTVDQMMKNSTPTNSQPEPTHIPSLSPITERVSSATCLIKMHVICSIYNRVNNKLFSNHRHQD